MNTLRFKPFFLSITVFGLVTYILCILFDLVFPQWAMTEIWEILLPGFTGVSVLSFFVGAVDIFGYGLYITIVFVPLFNFFHKGQLDQTK